MINDGYILKASTAVPLKIENATNATNATAHKRHNTYFHDQPDWDPRCR